MKNRITNNRGKRLDLNGTSLTNAVFICIVVSIFTGALVLISHYQNLLNDRLYIYENRIDRNTSAFNYFLNNSEKIQYDIIAPFDVFDDGVSSYFEKKHWGFYDILTCKTPYLNDTITKIALVGQKKRIKDHTALYLTNYDKSLKLSGKTEIFGKIQVPNGIIEQAYINGAKGNSIKHLGLKIKSEDKLPEITTKPTFDYSNAKAIPIDKLDKSITIINRFDKPTKVIDLSGTHELRDITLKGNIVLVSNDSLRINKTANLQDILIVVPSVHVLPDFAGSIHVVAKERIDIDENSTLQYPSSIYVKAINDNPCEITIKKGSTIIGGIVIDGESHLNTTNRTLTLQDDVHVVGTIYCNGSTQLKGTVTGSVYTNKIHLKTASSNYENIILNATIDNNSLPKNFIELPLFNNITKQENHAIVKAL